MRRRLVGVVLVVALALAGCRGETIKAWTQDNVNDLRWREVVRLASGEEIAVYRHVRFRQSGGVGMPLSAPIYEDASLEIVPTPPGYVTWRGPIIPILLDRDPDNGEWIVIGGDDGKILWDFNGKPCPPQFAFRLREGVWYVQPIPVNLIGRRPNLLVDLKVSDDERYSSEAFSRVAIQRKSQQELKADNISPGIRAVGEVHEFKICQGYGLPHFKAEFMSERTNRPTLASFPRLDP